MKVEFTKRILAYMLDIIIVTVIAQLITGFIPLSDRAKASYENVLDLTNRVTEKQITTKEYNTLILDEQYNISRDTVIQELISIVIYILYFVIYSFYKDGQTIGKKVFKIRLKRKQSDKLTINSLVIRAFILYNIALKIVEEILIVSLSKQSYLKVSQITGTINIIIVLATIMMVIIRKDGRGLHDIASDTIVVNEEEKK